MAGTFGENIVPSRGWPQGIINLYRFLKYPRMELPLWLDYFQTRAEMKFLRQIPSPPSQAPTFLVISLSTFVYQVKLEAMSAAGMKQLGWRPVILMTSARESRIRGIFQAFGIEDFAYFEDFDLDEEQRLAVGRDADAFFEAPLDFHSVKEWTYCGSWIGPQILSSLSREAFKGAVDIGDPAIVEKLRKELPSILARVARSKKAIDHIAPDLGFVNEANYVHYGPLVDMAVNRGINVIQAIQPWRDDALMLKRLTKETRRIHPSSMTSETFKTVKAIPWTSKSEAMLMQEYADRSSGKWFLQARNQPGVREREDDVLRELLDLSPGKKVAVVFSHVLWDANLFYGEDLFDDLGDWFVSTVKAACANDNLNWVIKLHPANIWKRARERIEGDYDELSLIKEHIGELPEHVKLLYPETDVSALSLHRIADWAITVRGTAGMEAPCFGVGAITAGTGRYSGLGFTEDSASREEYLNKLETLHQHPGITPKQVELAKKHAFAVFKFRPWQIKSFQPVFRKVKAGFDPLDHNLRASASSLQELDGNADLKKFAEWAGLSDSADYIDLSG